MSSLSKFSIPFKKDDAFAFDPTGLDPEIINYLWWAKEHGERQSFLKRAIKFTYEYDHYLKGFLTRIISEHFSLVKYLVRKIGAAKRLMLEKERGGKNS